MLRPSEPFLDDYFDPKQPENHKIAARQAGILELQGQGEGRTYPETGYSVIRDGYKLTLVLGAINWKMKRRW
jgi:hypothetical protein